VRPKPEEGFPPLRKENQKKRKDEVPTSVAGKDESPGDTHDVG
jgi:hypothetical protein